MSLKITLKEQRHRTLREGRSLLDRATAEKRDLSASEQTQWAKLNDDIDSMDARLLQIEADEDRARQTDATFAAIMARPLTGAHMTDSDRDLDAQFRSAIANNDRRPINVLPAERRSQWQPGIERRGLATTSGSGMVGTTFFNRLVMHLTDNAAVLAAGATVVQTETGETLKVPRTTAHSTAAIVTEAGTIGTSDPTLGSVSYGAYKYGFLVKVSHELANDASFDLLGYLAEQSGIAIGNAFGAHAITGTGTGQPTGIVTGATLGVTGSTAVAGAFNADNLIDLYHSIAEPYARSSGAAWLMRNATLGAVRKLKDSQNRYLFDINAPLGSGASGTLLGRPVYADPNVAAVGLSAKSVIFGDLSRYWVRQAEGVRFERSDEFSFNTDEITFRALVRLDGALVDASCVKYFSGGAS